MANLMIDEELIKSLLVADNEESMRAAKKSIERAVDSSVKAWVEQPCKCGDLAAQSEWDGVVRPQDFTIETYRGNRGGFIVEPEKNVRVRHLPTGMVTSCESERSAHGNKARAWESLIELLEAHKKGADDGGGEVGLGLLPEEAEMSMVGIGHLDLDDGRDWYYMVKRSDDILSLAQVEDWFLKKVYEESSGPGGLFCHRVRCISSGSAGNEFICIAEVRRDW